MAREYSVQIKHCAALTSPLTKYQTGHTALPKNLLRPPRERSQQGPYGAGTLITVFTMVTDAFKASTLPLIVVTVDDVDCPGLEIVIPG